MVELFAYSGDPDQMTHSAESDLGLHFLPATHLGVTSIQYGLNMVMLPSQHST